MPHISVEYSANLEAEVDIGAFCDALRRAALATGAFSEPGVRVRALRCEHYAIADGAPENAFIDISVRLRGGRPMDLKKAATAEIFAAAETFLAPVLKSAPIGLSLEMRDIDPELSPKLNTIRKDAS